MDVRRLLCNYIYVCPGDWNEWHADEMFILFPLFVSVIITSVWQKHRPIFLEALMFSCVHVFGMQWMQWYESWNPRTQLVKCWKQHNELQSPPPYKNTFKICFNGIYAICSVSIKSEGNLIQMYCSYVYKFYAFWKLKWKCTNSAKVCLRQKMWSIHCICFCRQNKLWENLSIGKSHDQAKVWSEHTDL